MIEIWYWTLVMFWSGWGFIYLNCIFCCKRWVARTTTSQDRRFRAIPSRNLSDRASSPSSIGLKINKENLSHSKRLRYQFSETDLRHGWPETEGKMPQGGRYHEKTESPPHHTVYRLLHPQQWTHYRHRMGRERRPQKTHQGEIERWTAVRWTHDLDIHETNL